MAYGTIVIRRGSAVKWANTSYIPRAGEPTVTSDTHVFKIGDGSTPWVDLPTMATMDAMLAAIQEAVGDIVSGDFVTYEDFQDHIIDDEPHPVYDDGTSFLLRYENAKV